MYKIKHFIQMCIVIIDESVNLKQIQSEQHKHREAEMCIPYQLKQRKM